MKKIGLVMLSALAMTLWGVSGATAGEGHDAGHGKDERADATKKHAAMACTAPVRLTEAAERKLGGARYQGPLPLEATRAGRMRIDAARKHGSHKEGVQRAAANERSAREMPEMAGTHGIHKGFRGGDFIMVPNQLHHIEAVYSGKCGLQLFTYNAYSEPISVGRFRAAAVIRIEGKDGNEREFLRFLVPSKDGTELTATIADPYEGVEVPEGMFEAELYVQFPEDPQPLSFDLILGKETD